ncbi:hypothetical protein QQS21_009626 [Conoideocrella luteorostrata]|uniref:BTB domain-containing protein n=1 Tax=Conoideocrella luteorostrata TaxID=1105319 RepID=A0AAJ0CGR2_9HYPO|nr:hypothetical protein QQS21_009626 [Conoideocrella luteorostrata]
MASDYKVFDSSGDVLIIQIPSTEPFAPFGEQTCETELGQGDANRAPKLFKAILEPDTLHNGLRRVVLRGFDSLAFQHVLNIIHHKFRLVPKTLAVEDLAKIAVIVDHLECHDAVALAAETWVRGYNELPKDEFSRPVVLWLLVSTVFNIVPIFDSVATVAIRHGTGPLDTLGLPISKRIVALLDERRQGRIEELITALYELIDKLIVGTGCATVCDSYHLGRLLKRMNLCKIYPRPSDLCGISVSAVSQMVHEFGWGVFNPDFVLYGLRNDYVEGACRLVEDLYEILSTAALPFDLSFTLRDPPIMPTSPW